MLNTELHIPDNTTIKYLRLYYYNNNATARLRAYLIYDAPGILITDMITIDDIAMDATVPGYGFVVSQEVTHLVNNVTQAYTLIGWPSAGVNNIYICGLRLAYYEPVVYRVYMPIIRK